MDDLEPSVPVPGPPAPEFCPECGWLEIDKNGKCERCKASRKKSPDRPALPANRPRPSGPKPD